MVPIFHDFLNDMHLACQTSEGFIHLTELLIQILMITRDLQLIGQCSGIRLIHLLFQIG